jgi:hypothetical protein
VRRNPNAVIDIAETIARKNDLLIVVCVFEFQNIAEFTDTDKFQQLLHQRWQEHDNVAYCLCGSKPHVMKEIFAQHKPFHDFGDIIYLNKIGLPNLVEFFDRRFSETGKTITTEASRLIAELVDNHPYYAQQLAQLAWLRTMLRCDTAIVREAHAALVEQLSLLFVTITESLTTQQLCYLKALLSGEKAISTAEVMHRYQISSATSVARSKIALVKNEILDNSTGHPSFLDPLYAYWLKTQFFKIS